MTHRHTRYDIQVSGHLDEGWQSWFDDLTISQTAGGDTVLSGVLVDQAALYGVLKKIINLGLVLISINPSPEPYTKGT